MKIPEIPNYLARATVALTLILEGCALAPHQNSSEFARTPTESPPELVVPPHVTLQLLVEPTIAPDFIVNPNEITGCMQSQLENPAFSGGKEGLALKDMFRDPEGMVLNKMRLGVNPNETCAGIFSEYIEVDNDPQKEADIRFTEFFDFLKTLPKDGSLEPRTVDVFWDENTQRWTVDVQPINSPTGEDTVGSDVGAGLSEDDLMQWIR
jgi:hypothetical protein